MNRGNYMVGLDMLSNIAHFPWGKLQDSHAIEWAMQKMESAMGERESNES